MKTFLTLFLLGVLLSCGKGSGSKPLPPVGKPDSNNYIPVAQAVIHIRQGAALASYSVISSAYAQTVPVNYVLAPSATFTVNATGISPVESGETLNIGTAVITALSTNALNVCGTGSQKCNRAAIRVYSQPLVAAPTLAGLVNVADNYSAPVSVNGTLNVGLGSTNSAIVEEIVIPSNLNRLRISNFTQLSNSFSADFSNAGAGSYQMVLVIELALARI